MSERVNDGERRILRMWTRSEKGAAPQDHEAIELIEGEGVAGDHKRGGRRQVTFLFQDEWREAEAELGREVDPAGRRANVYLSGGNGSSLIGKTVRVGETVVTIQGETTPCELMEQAAPGLEKALEPNCRGGVWGLVTTGGTLRPGDAMTVAE